MIAMIKRFIERIKSRLKDPISHCEYYKKYGCAHVDGLLCSCEEMDKNSEE
ncbi:hypothetical protein M2132_001827 [Dysgonomonas sp. PH5-45]|nr:hypothetical protein [Dysgonomonas sp. PH5-45]MDH6388380.1 hypothetical protein [Dysgonomonas sp. PH5-37]